MSRHQPYLVHRRRRHRPLSPAWWAELVVPTSALRLGALTDRDCGDNLKLARPLRLTHW